MLFHFEVDSTESVWYMHKLLIQLLQLILKLTPQSQYGIAQQPPSGAACSILKLTPQSQYGIAAAAGTHLRRRF